MKITKSRLKQIITEELRYSNLKESQVNEGGQVGHYDPQTTKLVKLLQAAGLDEQEQSLVVNIIISGDEELKDEFFGSSASGKLMDFFIHSDKAEAYGVEPMPQEVQKSGGEGTFGTGGTDDWILQQLENLTSTHHDPDESRPQGTLPDQLNTASMHRPGLEEQSKDRLRQIVKEQLSKAIKEIK